MPTDDKPEQQNHPYSHTPLSYLHSLWPTKPQPSLSDEPWLITHRAWFQNIRFAKSPSMSLPMRSTSYHTTPEESTKINPNNFPHKATSQQNKTTNCMVADNHSPRDLRKPNWHKQSTNTTKARHPIPNSWDSISNKVRTKPFHLFKVATSAKSVSGLDPSSVNSVANQGMSEWGVWNNCSVHSVKDNTQGKENPVINPYDGKPRLCPYTVSTLAILEKLRGVQQ